MVPKKDFPKLCWITSKILSIKFYHHDCQNIGSSFRNKDFLYILNSGETLNRYSTLWNVVGSGDFLMSFI